MEQLETITYGIIAMGVIAFAVWYVGQSNKD